MTRAIRITVDSKVEDVEISDWTGIAPSIGADWFDIVRLKEYADMYVDDTGLLTDRPVNMIASCLATESAGFPRLIVGDVLIAGHDGNGNTVDVPEWVVSYLKSFDIESEREKIRCALVEKLVAAMAGRVK